MIGWLFYTNAKESFRLFARKLAIWLHWMLRKGTDYAQLTFMEGSPANVLVE